MCAMLEPALGRTRNSMSLWRRIINTKSVHNSSALKPLSEMPGPRSYPIVKSLPAAIASGYRGPQIFKFLIGLHKIHGPIYKMNMPYAPTIVSTINIDDIENLCRATLDNPIRFGFESIKYVRDNAPGNYFNKKGGLLPENGEEWWRLRSRVQTHMMKPKNVARYLPSMDDVSIDFMDRIWEIQAENNGEMPDTFQDELYKWALESVSLVALNRRMGCLDKDLSNDSTPMKLINATNDLFGCLAHTETDYTWKFIKTKKMKQLIKTHDTFVNIADASMRDAEASLQSKSEKDDADNIMRLLLQTPGLSRTDVMTMILDTIMAGIDTTAHTIVFVMYLLAKNPECQKKLQEEVDSVIGPDQKENITVTQLNKMHYLKAVLKETLRIQPLLPGIGRLTTDDLELSGYLVPKNTLILGLTMITSKFESAFKKAEDFRPERWFRDKPLGEINSFASLPFSHGKRMCIGRRIAEQEMYTLLIRMTQRFTIEYNYDHPLTFESKLVFIPTMPLTFSFKQR